jgi:UPF0288 family protein (methanogenesis marker protein 3)
MSKNDTSGKTNGVKRQMPLGQRFTPMTAKQAAEASARARNIRKQVRAQILDTLVNNLDFGAEMLKAIKKGDMDQVSLIEKAMTIIGITHNQSEEVVNKIQVDANVDAKTETTIKTVKFVLDKQCPEQQQN